MVIKKMKRHDDAIAIIGYSYKLPGDAFNDESLWSVLNLGNNVYSDVCKSGRWDNEYHDNSESPTKGKAYVTNAGLLDNIKEFDCNFFDIPAVEANYLDPQQRILLETSWHALEHANINPHSLKGTNTSIFVGMTTDDYSRLHAKSGLPINAYTGIGSAKSIAAGRLAYFYDFKGSVIQLDTTCSSSLVCLHLASEELRKNDSDLALVGGVNAILSPDTTIGFCEMKALSKSGKLSAFDENADGYIRGEGGGIFVLKRLKDAENDGDNIHAIILGSAINHDGRTNGLTAPNPTSQVAVIKQALKNAKLGINDIDYVETHGTGTKLGDLIESNALGSIFTDKKNILEIGSIKANIGHLEAASGIASLAKSILMLKKREIPGQVNLHEKSTKIDWKKLNLNIDAKNRGFPQQKKLKIGISGFGMSGTNAHIIIGEYINKTRKLPLSYSLNTMPLFLCSAKNKESLFNNATNLKHLIEKNISNSKKIEQLSIATQKNRAHFKQYRSAFYLNNSGSIIDINYEVNNDNNMRNEIVFVFTGQGTHYKSMGTELYKESLVFKETMDTCAKVFELKTSKNLLEIINDNNQELLNLTENTQPAIVAIEIAIAKFWQSLGVIPTAVVGHSIGEYAAAVTAGCLEIEDAMQLAIVRGESIAKNSVNGIMITVIGDEEKIKSLIEILPEKIDVASYNSPINITLSLSEFEKKNLLNILEKLDIKHTELPLDYPFHSRYLVKASNDFYKKTKHIIRNKNSKIIWEKTGQIKEDLHDYFTNQIISPVYFEKAIKNLVEKGYNNFLEIGPTPALGRSILAINSNTNISYSLNKNGIFTEHMTQNIAKLYLMGLDLDWNKLSIGTVHNDLPLYDFSKKEYWLPQNINISNSNSNSNNIGFNLQIITNSEEKIEFLANINRFEQPHILDHHIFDVLIFAGASWIALAIQAGQVILGTRPICIESLTFLKPLLLNADDRENKVFLEFEKIKLNTFHFKFYSENGNNIYCEGILKKHEFECNDSMNFSHKNYTDLEHYSEFYDHFREQGYTLGPSFQWISSGFDNETESFRILAQPDDVKDLNSYSIYPGLLDSCFHALYSLIVKDFKSITGNEIVIPSEIKSLIYFGNPLSQEKYSVSATILNRNGEKLPDLCGGFNLVSKTVGTIINVESIKFGRVSKKLLLSSAEPIQLFIGKKEFIDYPVEKLGSFEEKRLIVNNHIIFSDFFDFSDGTKAINLVINDLTSDNDEDIVNVITENCLYIKEYLVNNILPIANMDIKIKLYAFIKGVIFEENINVINSSIYGFLKSAIAEINNVSIVLIDGQLDHSNLPVDGIDVFNELVTGEYIYTNEKFQKMEINSISNINNFNNNGMDLSEGVVIIIGAGGLLIPTIDWLLNIGSTDIVIFSKTQINKDIEQMDKIKFVQGDVLKLDDVKELFEFIYKNNKKVIGIIHIAGSILDQSFFKMDEYSIKKVINPKLQGCINLEKFWRAADIKLFLTYTSFVIYYSSAMQSNYTAANYAVSSWVTKKRSEGINAISIALGPVKAGMADDIDIIHKQRLHRLGVDFIPIEKFREILFIAMNNKSQLVTYALKSKGENLNSEQKLINLENITEDNVIENLLCYISKLLGKNDDELKANSSLMELGADSLLAVEISSWIQNNYLVSISMEKLLVSNTLKSVGQEIYSKINKPVEINQNEWVAGEI